MAISYTASPGSDVVMELRNIPGRLVRILPCGVASAGINTATWNLRNSRGARVPAGRYRCTLNARGPDGTQTRAVRAVHVRR